MALYPGPNIASFRTYFLDTNTGREWSSTTYWEAASTQITSANADAAAQAYHTQFGAAANPLLNNNIAIARTSVRVFATGSLVEGSYATAIAGGVTAGSPLPVSVAVTIQRKTGKFGRSNAGRIFIAGVDSTMQDDGVLNGTGAPAAKAIATFLGADRTFSVAFHSRHWNRKDNQFYAVTHCYAVMALSTRRDRNRHRSNAVA